jgi:hypothetical protein
MSFQNKLSKYESKLNNLQKGGSPLFEAFDLYRYDEVKKLINDGADVNEKYFGIGDTFLQHVVKKLEFWKDADRRSPNHPHITANITNLIEIIYLLIDKKVNLDGILFKIKDISIAKIFVENRADVNMVDAYGNNPIDYHISFDMINLFIKHGAHLNTAFDKSLTKFFNNIRTPESPIVLYYFDKCKLLIKNNYISDIITTNKITLYLHFKHRADGHYNAHIKELLILIFAKFPEKFNFRMRITRDGELVNYKQYLTDSYHILDSEIEVVRNELAELFRTNAELARNKRMPAFNALLTARRARANPGVVAAAPAEP